MCIRDGKLLENSDAAVEKPVFEEAILAREGHMYRARAQSSALTAT